MHEACLFRVRLFCICFLRGANDSLDLRIKVTLRGTVRSAFQVITTSQNPSVHFHSTLISSAMTNYADVHVFVPTPCDSLSTAWSHSTIAVPLYLVLVVELARDICIRVARSYTAKAQPSECSQMIQLRIARLQSLLLIIRTWPRAPMAKTGTRMDHFLHLIDGIID